MTRILTDLDLRYVDGRTWELMRDFDVALDELGNVTVEAGFHTDFNSIPRGLWNILPPEDYGEAAVIHDHLYVTGTVRGRAINRAQADRAHRELLMYRHASRWKVMVMFLALRWGGWKAWHRYRARDAAREPGG